MTLATIGSAAIAMCGSMERGVDCFQAGWAAEKIAKNCQWNGESEGKVFFRQVMDITIVVRHSSDRVSYLAPVHLNNVW